MAKPAISGNVKEDNSINWKLKEPPGCLTQLESFILIWFKYFLIFIFGFIVGSLF